MAADAPSVTAASVEQELAQAVDKFRRELASAQSEQELRYVVAYLQTLY